MVNKLKIETSISLRMRAEEVEIHGKSNFWDIGRGRAILYDEEVVLACLRLFREKNYKILVSIH